MKDERIQVLEKRMEETVRDNNQLREDLVALRKQKEQLETKASSSPKVPSQRDSSAEVIKYKEQVEVLHDSVRELCCCARVCRTSE